MPLRFGVDYYPEHWPKERWATDVKLMRNAHVNVVRLAEFAWSKLEPEEGRFEFNWLDEIAGMLHAANIDIVMCTPTAAPAVWVSQKYPEILPVGADGRRGCHGGRRHYCITSPKYRELSATITRALAEHYSDHPAVIGWQIDNEFGGPKCFCENCAAEFRAWLKRKYGSLDRLNSAWGNAFWSIDFFSWDQIPPANWEGLRSQSPHLQLDFQRFFSDATVSYQREQVKILHELCPKHFVTHNLMGRFPELNYFDLAQDLDIVVWDNYPNVGYDYREVGFSHDLMRGLLRKNFWVMEHQLGMTNWGTQAQPSPGQARVWTYQSVAHGADAIVYFRWRMCRWAHEMHHSAVLTHDGRAENRHYEEVRQIGSELQRVGDEILGSQVVADVAIAHSYDNLWALRNTPYARAIDYWRVLTPFLRGASRLALGLDVINLEGPELPFVPILITPVPYLLSPRAIANLRSYVERGGILVSTFLTSWADQFGAMSDQPRPAGLTDIFGAELVEFSPLLPNAQSAARCAFPETPEREYRCHSWCDWLKRRGANALGTYTANYWAGQTAVTHNLVGKGQAIYIGALFEEDFYRNLLEWLAGSARIPILARPADGVEVMRRRTDQAELIFVMNHSEQAREVKIEGSFFELLSGNRVRDNLAIGPLDVLILQRVLVPDSSL